VPVLIGEIAMVSALAASANAKRFEMHCFSNLPDVSSISSLKRQSGPTAWIMYLHAAML